MARKRKKATSRRRRRMGAIGKAANLQSILGIVGGAVAAKFVTARFLPNVDSKIKNAGVIALGALVIPKVLKGDLGKALGNGMIAVGGAGLAADLLPGIGAVDTIEFPVNVGEIPDNISVIAGDDVMAGDDLSVLAGMDEDEDSGF